MLLSRAGPPHLDATQHPLPALLPLSRARSPALSSDDSLAVPSALLALGSFLSILLLLSESVQLVPRFLPHLRFLRPSRFQYCVQKFDFIVVQTAELVSQTRGLFEGILLRGSSP